MSRAALRAAAARRHSSSTYGSAAFDWVSDDYDGSAANWVDRISGTPFVLGTTPPTWNPIARAFDFDGVNDCCEAADTPNMNFDNLQDFTVAVVLESLAPGQVSKAILCKKASAANTTAGWMLRTNGTGLLEFLGSDGTTQGARNTQAMPTVAATVGARMSADFLSTFVDEVPSTASTNFGSPAVGSMVTTSVLRLGAFSGTTKTNFGAFRIFRATIWRVAI